MALTIQSPQKSIIKAVWAFFFLFLPFPLPPIISHSAKHNLKSSKTQVTVDGSIVFYSALWHWQLLGCRDCSQCLHSQRRMIAGQTISSSLAGLRECRHLPPSLSPISVSSLQTDVEKELFQAVQHLTALSTISLRSHPGESGKRLKVLQKLLEMWFPKGILDVVEENISSTQKWRGKRKVLV